MRDLGLGRHHPVRIHGTEHQGAHRKVVLIVRTAFAFRLLKMRGEDRPYPGAHPSIQITRRTGMGRF